MGAGDRRGSAGREFAEVSARDLQVAVLPVQNLSGAAAPLAEIRGLLTEALKARGLKLLDEKRLEEFMAGYRMRYTGGIDDAVGRALRDQTGTGAVLISSLELYDGTTPPKISLISRLVSTADPPVILWMDAAGMTGDDSPGLLDLGVIEDPRAVLRKVVHTLCSSLESSLSGPNRGNFSRATRKKFQPTIAYRSSALAHGAPRTMAVLPFLNQSLRKHAGEILMLHFVRELTGADNIRVVEPGVVRRELLTYRIIMDDGVSLADADVLSGTLDAELLLTGKVSDYQDYRGSEGVPIVDFSLVVIERKSREVVWSSKSCNKGTDGVYFFDVGRERTACSMACEMARIVRERMLE